MKWVFLLAMVLAIPLLMNLLRSNPRSIAWFGIAIGYLPFGLASYHLYVAPISWPVWPGTVRGIEVSVLDSIALAMVVVLPRVRLASGVVLAFGLYFTAVLISIAVAHQKLPATFYAWQLIRTALLCVAVARASAFSPDFPTKLLIGGGFGLLVQSAIVTTQFAHGQKQAPGSFGQNTLGIVCDFFVMPAMALLLARQRPAFSLAVLLCGLIIVLGGGSRASIALFATGIVVTIAVSCFHRMTGRKAAIAAAAMVTLALSAPALLWAMNRRSDEARTSSNFERDAFKKAARMILADYPLGVGANQYVLVANLGGYSDRAGVPWNFTERSAPVHNTYYLVAAELGWFGLFSLIGLLGSITLVGLRAVKHAGAGIRAAVLVGALSTLLIFELHIAFEWTPMVFVIHYLLATCVGLILGLRLDFVSSRSRAPASRRTWAANSTQPRAA